MTYSEFVEWRLFNNLWPIGEKRQDLNFAQLCAVIAASAGSKPIPVQDFVMFKERNDIPMLEEQPTTAEITEDDISTMFGGKVKRISR